MMTMTKAMAVLVFMVLCNGLWLSEGGKHLGSSSSSTSSAAGNEFVKEDGYPENIYPKKPPVKTIMLPNGDIIDCVEIDSQPSLAHPTLQGHSIQRFPSAYPQELENPQGTQQPISTYRADLSAEVTRSTYDPLCPEGTIPIMRYSEEQIEAMDRFREIRRKSNQFMFMSPATGHGPSGGGGRDDEDDDVSGGRKLPIMPTSY